MTSQVIHGALGPLSGANSAAVRTPVVLQEAQETAAAGAVGAAYASTTARFTWAAGVIMIDTKRHAFTHSEVPHTADGAYPVLSI